MLNVDDDFTAQHSFIHEAGGSATDSLATRRNGGCYALRYALRPGGVTTAWSAIVQSAQSVKA